MTLTLTPAQFSALECSGLELDAIGDDQILLTAWNGRKLTVTPETQDALYRAINDASNSEDADAEQNEDVDMKRLARGASLALGNLASKVLRVRF